MQRSNGGGAFQAVDTLNGKLLCGCSDVHACVVRVHVHELVSSSYLISNAFTKKQCRLSKSVQTFS
ncbi:hypothetical protein WN943_020183 [Citrus x changshan-huyou]